MPSLAVILFVESSGVLGVLSDCQCHSWMGFVVLSGHVLLRVFPLILYMRKLYNVFLIFLR